MLFNQYEFIDLSHDIHSHIPTWDGNCGFQITTTCDYSDCLTETKFRIQQLNLSAGLATHIDAPSHCFAQGQTVDQIPLLQLFVPVIVIDLTHKLHPNMQLTTIDLQKFEDLYGKIPSGCFVIVHTGWSRYWKNPELYRHVNSKGNMQFPTISIEAAHDLLERQMIGIGIDTLSPDIPTGDYPVHRLILGKNKYIIENVVNANLLPSKGAYLIILPLKIVGGTESPVRMVGLKPKD